MSDRVRVILNDRPLLRPLTGVGHYIAELLAQLSQADSEFPVDGFLLTHIPGLRGWRDRARNEGGAVALEATRRNSPAGSPADSSFPPSHFPTFPPSASRGTRRAPDWLRRLALGVHGGAFRLAARRYALYHEPNHIPIHCDRPTVTTIHDLSVLVHPEWHPADRVRWYERAFDAGVRQTTRFIAVSEFTKREMVRLLGILPRVIDVTYQAPRRAFAPQAAARVRAVLAELVLPERFFLYAGTLEPRKNVPGLLAAYAALPGEVRCRHPLVLAGGWGWKSEALREPLAARAPGMAGPGLPGEQVRVIGYTGDAVLACLYSACTALIWPTLYEGFGLPPLEAMACGAPAIVSNVASLPEVVDDAGVLLDPHDTAGWTDAMLRVANDAAWRAELSAAGLRQAARFSWSRCAAQTAAAYRAALRA